MTISLSGSGHSTPSGVQFGSKNGNGRHFRQTGGQSRQFQVPHQVKTKDELRLQRRMQEAYSRHVASHTKRQHKQSIRTVGPLLLQTHGAPLGRTTRERTERLTEHSDQLDLTHPPHEDTRVIIPHERRQLPPHDESTQRQRSSSTDEADRSEETLNRTETTKKLTPSSSEHRGRGESKPSANKTSWNILAPVYFIFNTLKNLLSWLTSWLQ